ncbi:MAG: shikimate dehydrogenase family protein [Bacteroidota bacterium]
MTKKRYGLLGKTLNHSFSAAFFNEKFEHEKIHAHYANIELEDEVALEEWLATQATGFEGLNVTIPYKKSVLSLLDELDPVAESIGALNTIKIHEGRMKGFNTDAYGFQKSIQPFLTNQHEKALILGTGGASNAVQYTLENLGIDVFFLSRNPSSDRQFNYDEANEIMVDQFKLIINCTPLGTFPKTEEQPPFPIEWVGKKHLVIDLIYNPPTTQFLKVAAERGATTLNGKSMLQHQALKAWEIWNA